LRRCGASSATRACPRFLVEQNAKKILGVTDHAIILERGCVVHAADSAALAADRAHWSAISGHRYRAAPDRPGEGVNAVRSRLLSGVSRVYPPAHSATKYTRWGRLILN